MAKTLLIAAAACAGVMLGTHANVQADDGGASECREAYDDDAMYCRFFADDIIGDVAHVERVTGVPAYPWYRDADWEYYIFYWCYREAGVVLRFYPDGGPLSVMKGPIGFKPHVNYWECAQ
jgi:hypothetical protein